MTPETFAFVSHPTAEDSAAASDTPDAEGFTMAFNVKSEVSG